jgi:hypothetical protein
VTAVAAEREETTGAEALPDLARLTERQLLGIDCARCGAHLGVHARELGEVIDHGYLLRLWACDRPVVCHAGNAWRTAPRTALTTDDQLPT